MKRSIRTRLLLGTTLAAVVALAFASLATFLLFRRGLLHEYDELLRAKARTLASLVELKNDRVSFEFEEHQLSEFTRDDRPEYYVLLDENNAVLAASGERSAWERNLFHASNEDSTCQFVTLPDGRPGRMALFRFRPHAEDSGGANGDHHQEGEHHAEPAKAGIDGKSVILAVAKDTVEYELTLQRLASIQLAAAGLAVCLMFALTSWAISQGVRPLSQLARHAEQIDEHRLAERFEVSQAPVELVPIVEALNDLLARLGTAFTREKTFSSDVAHELRTPISGLRATIEVALSRTRGVDELTDALRECQSICVGIHRLVESLLLLVRTESGQAIDRAAQCLLAKTISEAWEPHAEPAARKHVLVNVAAEQDPIAAFEEGQMRIVLSNLFANAVEYCPVGGAIEISLSAASDQFELSVANSAGEATAETARHVFERFWRGDAARTDTGIHVGLGLSLAKRIVEAQGGKIAAQCTSDEFVIAITGKLLGNVAEPSVS
ncbi:ATP-binding protein [Lacipirellula sp.]|uniref:ATP-binding protein n=1 Tax=Lacipirellula sp. TaxID=2691419 RepID=UPI003D0AC59E